MRAYEADLNYVGVNKNIKENYYEYYGADLLQKRNEKQEFIQLRNL